MNITPINDFIIIKVDEEKRETDSGLLIAEGTMRLPNTGTIVSVSNEALTDLIEGTRVVFLRYASLDGPESNLRVCKLEHIIGVIDGKEPT